MSKLENYLYSSAEFLWGFPLIALMVGGGLYFTMYSRFLPYLQIPLAVDLIRGKIDKEQDEGHLSHFQSLATALSGTLGISNIVGVAVAISVGGPGALFWMWVTALVGVSTKFYTCSLAIMFRGRDSLGQLQGGPMYVIREGLGKKWMPLAIMFAIGGTFGSLPIFQVNQLVQILRDVFAIPHGLASQTSHLAFDFGSGVVFSVMITWIILGKIERVGYVSARIVPLLVVVYLMMTIGLLAQHLSQIPGVFSLILHDAFSGQAAASGVLTTVILIGVRRGAISNEAGIGTEAMAHGAAKTKEPIREGFVAMLAPFIDTLVVCTCTGLVIILTGAWQGAADGVSMTAAAFEQAYPGMGAYMLCFMVFCLSISTMITYWYYGSKSLGFLIGAQHQHHYTWAYAILVVVGSVVSLQFVISLIDCMYALMAFPTMISTLLLSKKVNVALKDYLKRHQLSRFKEVCAH